jgi:hypothetical protein
LITEVMLGEPGVVEPELVGAADFARHPRMHAAVRIGLRVGIGMGREQDAELHFCALPEILCLPDAVQHVARLRAKW